MKNFLNEISNTTLKYVDKKINKAILYNFHTKNFPKKRGVYFIYDKNGELVYIGCAHKAERNLKDRCSQYIHSGDTGATFTFKIMDDILHTPVIKRDDQAICNKDDMKKAIAIIKQDYKIRFLELDGNIKSSQIQLLEMACITAYNPKYND